MELLCDKHLLKSAIDKKRIIYFQLKPHVTDFLNERGKKLIDKMYSEVDANPNLPLKTRYVFNSLNATCQKCVTVYVFYIGEGLQMINVDIASWSDEPKFCKCKGKQHFI